MAEDRELNHMELIKDGKDLGYVGVSLQAYVIEELESAKATVVHAVKEQKEMAMWEIDDLRYEGCPAWKRRQIWKEYKQFEYDAKTELERLQAEIEAAVARFTIEDKQRETEKLRLEAEKRAKHREEQAAIARITAQAKAEKQRIALEEDAKEREAKAKMAKLEAEKKAQLLLEKRLKQSEDQLALNKIEREEDEKMNVRAFVIQEQNRIKTLSINEYLNYGKEKGWSRKLSLNYASGKGVYELNLQHEILVWGLELLATIDSVEKEKLEDGKRRLGIELEEKLATLQAGVVLGMVEVAAEELATLAAKEKQAKAEEQKAKQESYDKKQREKQEAEDNEQQAEIAKQEAEAKEAREFTIRQIELAKTELEEDIEWEKKMIDWKIEDLRDDADPAERIQLLENEKWKLDTEWKVERDRLQADIKAIEAGVKIEDRQSRDEIAKLESEAIVEHIRSATEVTERDRLAAEGKVRMEVIEKAELARINVEATEKEQQLAYEMARHEASEKRRIGN